MNELLILLTPLMVLLVLAAFGFSGCGKHLPLSDDPELPDRKPEDKPPPDDPPPPTPPTPSLPAAQQYEAAVTGTAAFAAFWPLNEPGGNQATVVGSLNPAANGSYVGIPLGSTEGPGKQGVLYSKDTTDLAPDFSGTAAYVDVPFNAQLNPTPGVTGFSVELWVNPATNAAPGEQVLLSSHRFDSAGEQQGYEIAFERHGTPASKEIHARVFANGGVSEISQLMLDQDSPDWLYIVFIYTNDGVKSEITLLVGVATTKIQFKAGPKTAVYESVLPAKQATLRFGAGHAIGQTATGFFAGRVDNVAFYNAPLSQGTGGDVEKHFSFF